MSRRMIVTGICLAAALISAAGCGSQVKYDQTFDLKPGVIQTLYIDAPKQDQTVKVVVSSSHPIDVVAQLSNEKKTLFTKKNMKDDSFEVKIPANQPFQIILSTQMDCKATIKVNSL